MSPRMHRMWISNIIPRKAEKVVHAQSKYLQNTTKREMLYPIYYKAL